MLIRTQQRTTSTPASTQTLAMARNANVVTSEPHPYVQNVGSTHHSTIQLFAAREWQPLAHCRSNGSS